MSISGTGDTDQVVQIPEGFGYVVWLGTGGTAQAAQESAGSGYLRFMGVGATSNNTQVSIGDSELLIVGSGDTTQPAQRARATGIGPPRQAPRPLRISRGDTSPQRPVVLTIRSGS